MQAVGDSMSRRQLIADPEWRDTQTEEDGHNTGIEDCKTVYENA